MQTTDILLCIILFFLICEALLMIKQKMSSKNSAERFTVKKSQDNQIYNNATPVQKSIPEPVDNLESQPRITTRKFPISEDKFLSHFSLYTTKFH